MSQIRILINENHTYFYFNDLLIDNDIEVKSSWLIKNLYNVEILDPEGVDYYNLLREKYVDFGQIPSIPDFIDNDMKEDMQFRLGIDIKYLYVIDKDLYPLPTYSELVEYLNFKFKRKPKRIKEFLS